MKLGRVAVLEREKEGMAGLMPRRGVDMAVGLRRAHEPL